LLKPLRFYRAFKKKAFNPGLLPYSCLAVHPDHTDNDDPAQHDLPFHAKACHDQDAVQDREEKHTEEGPLHAPLSSGKKGPASVTFSAAKL